MSSLPSKTLTPPLCSHICPVSCLCLEQWFSDITSCVKLSRAAMTNHHELDGLNQQKFILTVKNKTRRVPDYTLTQSVGFQLHSMMYSIFSTCYNEAGNRLNGVFIRGQPNLISIKFVSPTRAPFAVWHKFQQMVCAPSSGHENSYLCVAFLNGNSISQIMLTHT